MTSYETIRFNVDGGVATITLSRPDNANALNLTMGRELADVAIRCSEDDGVRSVLMTGEGRFFCAGGDLAAFVAAGDGAGALIKEMTMYFHAAISRFTRMDAPLVGAVNGVAAGAGFSLAASCDLLIAAETATFVMAYTAAGLPPDGSSSYFLPRQIGLKRTAELMLTNRTLDAKTAHSWGIVNAVVPDEVVLTEAAALATRLASGPTRAYGAVKSLLAESTTSTLETQMEREAQAIAALVATRDGAEGIGAFLEKRQADFRGV